MTTYQIIVTGISLYFIFDRIKKRLSKEPRQSFLKVIATIILWSSVICITLFPGLLDVLTQIIKIDKDDNSIIGVILIFSLVLFFKILSIIERIEKNITELVRRESLKKFEENL